jgi:hypothetical protein
MGRNHPAVSPTYKLREMTMPQIWEVQYGEESDFFSTRQEAERIIRWGNNEAALIRHTYLPTQEGVAKLLNHLAGTGAYNSPARGYSPSEGDF